MSITLHQRPDNYTPVYNELPFVVSSDQEGQTFFKYIVRLYNSLAFLPVNLLKEYALEPWPTDGGLVFDPGSVLKDYVSYDVSDIAERNNGFKLSISSIVDYHVQFIEQYGTDQALHASGIASGNVAINAALNFRKWVNLDIEDYLIRSGSQHKFLTNSPRTLRIRPTESYCLGYMSDADDSGINVKPDNRVVIDTYNEAGTLIGTYTIDNTFSLIDDERYINILCGPYDLNNATLTTGSQPVITDSVFSYTIRLQDAEENESSEQFTFTIDRNCTIYNKYRIYWLNRWGRFDAFTFKGYSRENTTSERGDSDFSRRAQGVKSGNSYSHSPQRHSVYPFYTQYKEGMRLESDIISPDELAWLEELMTSPAVFWQELADSPPANPENNFWAVNVKGPSTIDKKYRGAFNIGFDIDFGFKNHTQTR